MMTNHSGMDVDEAAAQAAATAGYALAQQYQDQAQGKPMPDTRTEEQRVNQSGGVGFRG